jgi:hypothetical protein
VLHFINTATVREDGTEGAHNRRVGGVAAGGGRPSTGFALLGYPRRRKNGGRSEVKRSRAGSPHGEPRTESPSEAAQPNPLGACACGWFVGCGQGTHLPFSGRTPLASSGGHTLPASRGYPRYVPPGRLSPESANTFQGPSPVKGDILGLLGGSGEECPPLQIHRWLVPGVAKQENGDMKPVSPSRTGSFQKCSTWNIPGGRSW